MRDLTDIFISNQTVSDITHDMSQVDGAYGDSDNVDYDVKVSKIRERLTKLTSAYIPGFSISNNWMYEACRIASLIYAASIIQRLPFSVTADPRYNTLVAELEVSSYSDAGLRPYTTCLSDALYAVLERTDIANAWGNMTGVLYWVSTVGAMAARSPTTTHRTQQPKLCDETRAVWVRRCLTIFSIRSATKIVFDHPKPLLIAQKKLLKVQELIRSYGEDHNAVGMRRM